MDVLLCWGSCSETASSGEHFQPVLIKQRLAVQVLRSISSEIFEPCLWLAASNSNHLTVGDVTPVSVEPARCSHNTQLGKHSLQPGHQTSLLASISHTMCSHTAVPHVHLQFYTLEIITAAESYPSGTLCTHRWLLDCYANNFLATKFCMQMFFNEPCT